MRKGYYVGRQKANRIVVAVVGLGLPVGIGLLSSRILPRLLGFAVSAQTRLTIEALLVVIGAIGLLCWSNPCGRSKGAVGGSWGAALIYLTLISIGAFTAAKESYLLCLLNATPARVPWCTSYLGS